jgi:hypothetical protein
MNYGMTGRGSIPGRGKRFFSPQRPDRFWGRLSLLSNGYCGLANGIKEAGP